MFRALQKENEKLDNNKYILAGMISIELFMSFSFLGYIHIEPISITLVYIPVLMTGSILGVKETALMGAVFGLASMWKASAFYVETGDAFFSPFLSGKPLQSILLSVGARTLFGAVIGVMYQIGRRGKHPFAGVIIVSSLGRTVHTFIVYLFMQFLFPEAGFTVANTITDIRRWEYVPFLIIADMLVGVLYIFRRSAFMANLFHRVEIVDKVNAVAAPYRKWLIAMLAAVFACSFSVAVYFTNRIRAVMAEYGLTVHERTAYDIMHLQIQFLFGIISLAALVVIVIMLYQNNYNYLYYEARLDGLTGLLGRQLFFQTGEKMLARMKRGRHRIRGCFVILDIDDFKKINDIYGHPEGDRALKEIAKALEYIFGNSGIIGRLGGDELVMLIDQELSKKEIEAQLNKLKNLMSGIQFDGKPVTCSIGVIPVEAGYSIEELYKYADRLLYEAKKGGKDQFAFGYRFEAKEKEDQAR